MADAHEQDNHRHDRPSELSETHVRVRALETILVEKGYLDSAALEVLIETYETKIGPHNGARVVAKAWVDQDYRRWLFAESSAAIASLAYATDPRGVLRDFGVELPPDTEIRVWDSTAEVRYLVVPMRPAGTDGWNEDELARLVTRDSMIGTGLPKSPEAATR